MKPTMRSLPLALILALGVLAIPTTDALALSWTCSTVAQEGEADPGVGVFKTRFDDPAINSSGDVAFHARVRNAGRRVYLYPAAGAPIIVATKDDTSPGPGGDFRKFGSPSINDAGDVGFFADLDNGDGAFIRESGGTLKRAAGTDDVSPTGGTFDKLLAVSRVNADGDLAFFARVAGGDDGIFLFDESGPTVLTVAAIGDSTGDGRFFCDFIKGRTVDLSDSGNATFQAKTATDCLSDTTTGVWLQTGIGTFANVADVGAGSSVVGTTYNRLFGAPLVNASDEVLFRAKVRPTDTCADVDADPCTTDADCGRCVGGTNNGEACVILADCPDTDPANECTSPECGGDRCLGGASIGTPCGSDSDCPDASCGVPGTNVKALFLYDPSGGPATTTVAAEKNTAPGTGGGTLKTLASPGGLSDAGHAAFRSKVRSSSAKHGAFVFNGTAEDIVLASDAVPTDAFGLGSVYRKIVEQTGFSRSGTWFTYSARVKDFSGVPSNGGLFRCEGL